MVTLCRLLKLAGVGGCNKPSYTCGLVHAGACCCRPPCRQGLQLQHKPLLHYHQDPHSLTDPHPLLHPLIHPLLHPLLHGPITTHYYHHQHDPVTTLPILPPSPRPYYDPRQPPTRPFYASPPSPTTTHRTILRPLTRPYHAPPRPHDPTTAPAHTTLIRPTPPPIRPPTRPYYCYPHDPPSCVRIPSLSLSM